jgi:hypothetical protein
MRMMRMDMRVGLGWVGLGLVIVVVVVVVGGATVPPFPRCPSNRTRTHVHAAGPTSFLSHHM